MTRRWEWWIGLMFAALLASSGIVGCGCGDDDDDDSGGGTTDDDSDDDADDDVGDDDTGDDDTGDDDTVLECEDGDGDARGANCDAGEDCDDADPNNWVACDACADADADGWWIGCDTYETIAGEDCDDADANNWVSCGECVDNDGDTYFTGCDGYDSILGPDCNDADADIWQFLTGWSDEDGDQYPGTENEVCSGVDLPPGYYLETTDCDDANILVNPDGTEIPDDGIDQDCSGEDYVAADSNGYFVDGTGGNDANPGTMASPVETIAQGIFLASITDGGTNVYIAGGTYTEDVGTSVASLYGGYDASDWSRDIDANETELIGSVDYGLVVGSAAGVAVDGMTLRGKDAVATPTAGLVVGGSNGVFITNNKIYGGDDNTGTFSVGAEIVMTFNAMLAGNEIAGGENATSTSMGIYAVVNGFDVVNNTISGGESASSAMGGYILSYGDATIRDNVIDGGESAGATFAWMQIDVVPGNNDVRGNEFTMGDSSAGPRLGFYQTGIGGSLMFRGNSVRDTTSAGPLYQGFIALGPMSLVAEGNVFEGSRNATTALAYTAIIDGNGPYTIANNMFDGGQATSFTTAMLLDVDDIGGSIVNNTFAGGTSGDDAIAVYTDIDGAGGPAHLNFINNIIDAGSGPGDVRALYLGQSGDAGLMHLAGNDLTGASPDCLIYASTGAECVTTIGAVNNCTWHDCGSAEGNLSAAPQYVNAGVHDYHIASGSPMRDAGVDPHLYVADPFGFAWRDFEGDVRPAVSTWDIGADEFIP